MARKGLPKAIIKKYGITKKAWQVYRGKKKRTSTPTKSNPKRKTRRKSNPGHTPNSNNNNGLKIPIPLVLGAGVGHFVQPYSMWVAPAVGIFESLKGSQMNGSPLPEGSRVERMKQAFGSGVLNFTGWRYDTRRFDFSHAPGLHGEVIGFVAHEVLKRLGVNRILGRYKVPLIRM